MRNYDWYLDSTDSAGAEAPSVIGEKFVSMLDRLSQIDPVLSGWSIWEDNSTLDELEAWADKGMPEPAPIKAIPIAEARADMTALVEANVQLDDWGEPRPDEGYDLMANNKHAQTSRGVSVSVHAGAKYKYNRWSARFGDSRNDLQDPAILTYPIVGGVFRTLASIWPTPWARAPASLGGCGSRPFATTSSGWDICPPNGRRGSSRPRN